jgi:anti-sigma regulatory factor (Ser/Thr protein kinase)
LRAIFAAMSAARMRHDLLVHDGEADFEAHVVPFLRAGIADGETVLAVAGSGGHELLADALGPERDAVTFIANDTVYTRPEAALASYDRTLRSLYHRGATTVRAVAVMPVCETVADWQRWISYEAIVNRALAHHPAWVVCAYDSRVVDADVVEDLRATHPQLGGCACHEYRDPAEIVRERACEPDAAPLAQLRSLPLPIDAPAFRAQLTAEMSAAGVAADRACEMRLAASEVYGNASRHGCGLRAARAGLVDERFVCELSDHGPGIDDPLTGYLPPREGATGGFGMWVARQATERMDLETTPEGLTVRLWI